MGKPIALTSSRGALDAIAPTIALSDAAGAAAFAVTPSSAGTAVFSARAIAEDLSLGAASVAFVAGTPILAVTPARGPVQRTVRITGGGFAPNVGSIDLLLGDSIVPITASPLVADANGAFSANITLPTTPLGATSINATQGLLTAHASYAVVNPSITINTATTTPGASITLTGTDFYPTLPVTLRFDASTLDTVTADADGAFAKTVAVPPTATGGAHTVAATQAGAVALTASATLAIVVPPRLDSATPATAGQGAVGRVLALSGGGFASGMTASAGAGVTVRSLAVQNTTAATLTVDVAPTATAGARDLTLTNPDGGAATFAGALTIAAAPVILAAAPSELVPGAAATPLLLTGSGLQSGATASVSGAEVSITNFAVTSANAAAGSIEATPGATPGARTFTLTNPDGGTGATTLRVLGTLTDTGATLGAGGALTLSARLATALPLGSRLRAGFPAGTGLAGLTLSAVAAGGANCAGSARSAVAQTATVSLPAACAPRAGTAVGLTVAGITLPPPPAPIIINLRTETADGAGLDRGVVTLWRPTLTLSRTSAVPGESLQATGAGYPPGAAVVLALEAGSAAAAETLATFGLPPSADAQGVLTATVVLPGSLITGPHRLIAAAGAVQATTVMMVLPVPTLRLSPPAGGAGQTVRFAGSSFLPGESVTLRWDNDASPLSTLQADPDGVIAGRLTLPAGAAPGTHSLTALGDGGRTAAAPFTMSAGSPTLRGRIVERGSGVAIANATGWANQAGASNGPFAIVWNSGPDGAFGVQTPPGAYNVGVAVEGRAVLTPEQGVALASDGSQTPETLVIEVASAEVRLEGRVTQGTGVQEQGVGGASVTAYEMTAAGTPGGLTARAHTDATGGFRFGLPAGRRWTLNASGAGLALVAAPANGGLAVTGDLTNIALPK
ncbi:MAG: hypothetical protein NTZ05_21755 [Chloroflexi bacterium]|nr:hypothetical protein [Chloroflexota bacterium]